MALLAASQATKNVSNSLSPKTKTALLIGGGLLVGFILLKYANLSKGIFQKIGLLDTQEEKDVKDYKTTQDYRKAFEPSYYKSAPAAMKQLSQAQLSALAKTIRGAFGFFNDNEEQIYGALRQVPTKADMSRLSEAYFNLYREDLYGALEDKLNDSDEMGMVINIVKSKP